MASAFLWVTPREQDLHLPKGTGSRTQVAVQAPERLGGRHQILRRLHHDAVVGVDDIRDGRLGDLRQQLVGIHRMQPAELADPANHG